jgi:hypothetical protein
MVTTTTTTTTKGKLVTYTKTRTGTHELNEAYVRMMIWVLPDLSDRLGTSFLVNPLLAFNDA